MTLFLKMWGQLSIINVYECDESLLVSKAKLREFVLELCRVIKMKPYGKPRVERFGTGRLEGLSALQFIETSTITVHLDEFGKRAFIDIFSCKKFDSAKAARFSKNYFKAGRVSVRTIERK